MSISRINTDGLEQPLTLTSLNLTSLTVASNLAAPSMTAPILTGVSSIRNANGVESLALSTTEPVLRAGTGSSLIQARNTAKWWIACNGFTSIQSSYGISSISDIGSNQVQINFAIATTGGSYAAAISFSHAGGISWNARMNNGGQPTASNCNYRFSYGDSPGYSPFAWSAVGFGDQA